MGPINRILRMGLESPARSCIAALDADAKTGDSASVTTQLRTVSARISLRRTFFNDDDLGGVIIRADAKV
jgi:hypothetical protein